MVPTPHQEVVCTPFLSASGKRCAASGTPSGHHGDQAAGAGVTRWSEEEALTLIALFPTTVGAKLRPRHRFQLAGQTPATGLCLGLTLEPFYTEVLDQLPAISAQIPHLRSHRRGRQS
jgi:hypothetical protein